MNLLFFGTGGIGGRHINWIRKLYHDDHSITQFRVNSDDWDHLKDYDVAFICLPTNYHIPVAVRCLRGGITKIFIEKPLGANYNGLNELLSEARNRDAVVYVAYPFRHSDQMNSWRRTIPRNCTEVRIVCGTNVGNWYKPYSINEATGGGAVFELSHEVDIAKFLFGPIDCIRGCVNHQENPYTSAETKARLLCEHRNHLVKIELDLLSEKEERFIQFNGCKFDYKISDKVYLNQLKYFFDNIDNPNLTNNVFEAAELFRKIVDFKGRTTQCRS